MVMDFGLPLSNVYSLLMFTIPSFPPRNPPITIVAGYDVLLCLRVQDQLVGECLDVPALNLLRSASERLERGGDANRARLGHGTRESRVQVLMLHLQESRNVERVGSWCHCDLQSERWKFRPQS